MADMHSSSFIAVPILIMLSTWTHAIGLAEEGEKKDGLSENFQEFHEDVEADGWVLRGRYSQVDVESVDMVKFPGLKFVPWWSASVQKGDCLFIPVG